MRLPTRVASTSPVAKTGSALVRLPLALPVATASRAPARAAAAVLAAATLSLLGCASRPPATAPGDGWHAVPLPGKQQTRYSKVEKGGRSAVKAEADRSASMWRLKLSLPAEAIDRVTFSWWVSALPDAASVADARREDAAARVLFAFDGDTSRLPARTQALFDLAEALSGERPPYATLMYVWDATAPVGSVIVNPRTDRVRKIVVDSGTAALGRWREHQRDLRADFRLAFGEEPGALVSVAKMTDSDNTQGRAIAWYGAVRVLRPDGSDAVAQMPQ
jgi:hypothetical protein